LLSVGVSAIDRDIHDIWTTMPALDEVFPEGHHFGKYWGFESQVK
jgi:hypothetical protein